MEGQMEKMDLAACEVVRQDYFVMSEEALLTFNQGRMYVNNYCIRKFEDTEYIQVLINKEKKILIVKLLKEKKKDSFRWSTQGKKRKARHMRCVPLFYMVYKMMKWDVNCRYRITGHMETANRETILCFLLKDAQCFVPVAVDKNGRSIYKHQMPAEWNMTFGVSTREYGTGEFVLRYEEDGVYEIELPIQKKQIEKLCDSEKEEV